MPILKHKSVRQYLMSDFAGAGGLKRPLSAGARNSALDGLRGLAVTLTFLVHYCGTYMASFRGANPNVVTLAEWPEAFDKVLYWLFRSHHGVYLFFVLSGFLIAKISLGRNFSYLRFLRNRMLRIYPAFLLAFGICIALIFAAGAPLPGVREIVLNLIFLNGFPPAQVDGIIFNNVTWSLFYEMTFYLVLPVVLMVARYLRSPIPLAIAFAGILVSYGPVYLGFYSEFFLFLFAGALAGSLPAAQVKVAADLVPDAVVLGFYALITALSTLGYLSPRQFVWLFAILGLLLIGKAVAGNGWLSRGLAWRPLAGLGRISYSFYLLHSVSLAAIFRLWGHLGVSSFGLAGNAIYMGLLGFAGALILGLGSFMIAEQFYFRRKEIPEHRDPAADLTALEIRKAAD
jgi:exopolysaccharide production protein ExoZ